MTDQQEDSSEQELLDELEGLRAKIATAQAAARDAELSSSAQHFAPIQGLRLKGRKILKGHIAKVVAVDFAGDSKSGVGSKSEKRGGEQGYKRKYEEVIVLLAVAGTCVQKTGIVPGRFGPLGGVGPNRFAQGPGSPGKARE
ncbi:guanine nucleotide-binding protein subunit beta-2-like [Tropilaelaps mercedesae]|uniref:Guanine nucleotide-binding protein subunit beta-2-like n=1 Tax=Tropilaelaps mercedesae TaxID=418985 RepID=A0A1V9WXZ3_9ACAR|nr:guanine nucleotide-binding protein subunit beta-2-like [Tropilaelaps mercedesae]